MRKKHINEIYAVTLFAIGIIILVSLISYAPSDLSFYTSHPNIPAKNIIRGFGAYLSGILIFFFGWGSYLFSLLIFYWGARLFKQEEIDFRLPHFIGLVFFLLSASSILSMSANMLELQRFMRGGYFGFTLSNFITLYFGNFGGLVIFITLALLSFILATEILVSKFFLNIYRSLLDSLSSIWSFLWNLKPKLKFNFSMKRKQGPQIIRPGPQAFKAQEEKKPAASSEDEGVFKPAAPKIQIKAEQKAPIAAKPKPVTFAQGDYIMPALDLLDSPPPLEERKIKEDLTANARILEETLADFGISVKVTDIERGPVITRYELEPAPGVKLNKIVSLDDDIALTMKASSVRIVAPIPGKARVGIEVPNSQSNFVYLKEVLATEEFQRASSKLTLALGKDIAGKPIVADLDDMPHLLIAGTTGSGKTVCVNGLILSILYKATPEEVKFLMVDPKMVELAVFNGLPHLLCPVLTDPKKVSGALNWLVNEMGERFQLFARAGIRNIAAYNQKEEEKIPYIVVVIDELADLMMTAKDQVESAIARLAQLSRAVGIHLILATQRPSVDVITGVIKANFPARISFQVASKVDSRTVLDANGADKLLGKGDMLFLKPGESKLIRGQSSFVKDKEIDRVAHFIKEQAQPVYDEEIVKEGRPSCFTDGEKDDLFDEAVRLVMETGQASVSILQRRMRLGYTRAARLIDSMEQAGLVGPYEGSKPRKILADRKEWLKEEMQKQQEGV